MNLRNIFGILMSLAITLTTVPAAYGMGLDNVQGTVLDGTGATQIANLENQISSISYGAPLEGSLGDSNDAFNNAGIAYDLYRLTAANVGQPYVVTAYSPNFIIAVALYHYDAAQKTLTPLQVTIALQSNGLIQFSGILNQTGQFIIQVISGDSKTGAYNLRLDEQIPSSEPEPNSGDESSQGDGDEDPSDGFNNDDSDADNQDGQGFDGQGFDGQGSGDQGFDGQGSDDQGFDDQGFDGQGSDDSNNFDF